MKKICVVLVLLMLILSVASCSDKTSKVEQTVKSSVEPEVIQSDEVKSDIGSEESEKADNQKEADVNEPQWREIYKDLLVSAKAEVPFYYVGLNDLNFDGTPELVLSNNAASAACYISVFQIIDGKAECVLGDNMFDDTEPQYDPNEISLYSAFKDGWLKLKRNSLTGEYKYFMESGNGASNESFGGIYSFSADSVNCQPYPEFEYVETWEDDGYESRKGEYLVDGKEVTKDEYEQELDKFYEVWTDIGLYSCDMTEEYERCRSNMNNPDTDEAVLNLFKMYMSESSLIG